MNESTRVQRLLAARSRAARKGLNAESMDVEAESASPEPHTDDVLQRVHDTMRKMPESEMERPEDFERALSLLMQHGDRALRKLDADPEARLDSNEQLTLEAVIRTDGTRPTLLVRGDTVNPEHPLAGAWKDTLFSVRDRMRKRAAAVGRIEPDNGSPTRFYGTGWVVDSAKGLVLTNLHVLHAMLKGIPNAMIQTASGFRVLKGGAFIDFAAEDGSLRKNRFRIVEATPSGIDGQNFARLDVAVLRIEKMEESQAIPEAVPVSADLAGPSGSMASFCVIGFPAKPQVTSGIVDGVDWDWVTQTLFGNRFGVKRISPGTAHKPLGTIDGDTHPWVFGHDATTLGGNSGSPVMAWLDQGFGGFGIHFAGASIDKNCAHAIAQCSEQLKALGVPVQAVI